MNRRDLELFMLVAKLESLSAAGKKLGISPASVSKRLAHLERNLGVRLLHRTTRKVSLTETGRRFLIHSQRILEDWESALHDITQQEQTPRGLLRMTAPASFGRQHVSPYVPRFLERYPEIHLDVQLTESVIDMLDEGIDLAIRIASLPSSSFVAKKLADNKRLLCAAPSYLETYGYPQTPEDLQNHSCLHLWLT